MPYKRVLHAILILNPKLHLKTHRKNILLNILMLNKKVSWQDKKIKFIFVSVEKNQFWHKRGHKNVNSYDCQQDDVIAIKNRSM
jgi:hypothetical protein